MSDELNFDDLSLIEVPVTIAGKKYVLREADEDTAAAYRNAAIAGARIEDGQLTEMPSNLAGVQSLLVSRCLFPCAESGSPSSKPVPREVVGSWPSRIVKPLFERAKEISELDEDETLEGLVEQQAKLGKRIAKMRKESAKNAPSATMDGSV
jgi:hypothetical protein